MDDPPLSREVCLTRSCTASSNMRRSMASDASGAKQVSASGARQLRAIWGGSLSYPVTATEPPRRA